jgi:hypothetical protein
MAWPPLNKSGSRWILAATGLAMAVCLAYVAWDTRHWLLVNDPAQLDYVCFMIGRGWVPYGQMMEMNMPGIYMVNSTVMHVLGGGPLAWRLFDLALMLAMLGGMLRIAGKREWYAGLLGGLLFALAHQADGAANLGQRDLIIAVLVMWAYALLFAGLREGEWHVMAGMGFFLGAAGTVKPTPLPFAIVLIAWMAWRWRKLGYRAVWKPVVAACVGVALPLAGEAAWLVVHHAVHPLLYVLRVQIPFYTTIARPGYAGLLTISFPFALSIFVLMLCAVVLLRRQTWADWEHSMLVLGFLFGLVCIIVQHKGFVYHRYTMLAFLFLWASLQLTRAMQETAKPRVQWLAAVAMLFAVYLSVDYATMAHNTAWLEDYDNAVTADLKKLGGAKLDGLDGRMQCLTTQADCNTTLYRLKLAQSTGLIYDFFIFDSSSAQAVKDARQRFWQQMMADPPAVILMGQGPFPSGKPGYDRLQNWPQLADYVQRNYVVFDERDDLPRDQLNRELGFRMYVLCSFLQQKSGAAS